MENVMPAHKEYKVAIPDLRQLLEAGWGTGDIARKYEMSYKSVWWRIRKEKLPFHPDRSGRHNGSWKGGRQQTGRYVYIHCPEHPFATQKGCVLEHRLVMELKLGRYLLPSEVVHHRRGYKNSEKNLQLFATNGAHLAATLKGKVPKWTVQGKRRIREGIRRSVAARKKSNREKSKRHA
jgi:hypothetical protein